MALTFPSSPTNGQIYVDTVTGNRYLYDSTSNILKYAANNVGMSVSSSPPPINSVAPGAMWYNTNNGRTFIVYDDGDSKQWVENVPAVGSFDSSTVAGFANAASIVAVAPAYNTANVAFNTANAAFASANNVAPQVEPSYRTANAAFAKANSALSNTNNTVFEGNLRVSYTVSVPAFYENDANITMNVTISTGRNAFSAGPVAIANGVFVTIPDGSFWSVT